MNNSLVQLKIKNRLNKLSSLDSENLESWQIAESFNKGQKEWVRRQLEGINQTKTGKEETTHRISDLQVLITTVQAPFNKFPTYWESTGFPLDYMEVSRVSAQAQSDCCPARPLTIYLQEEGTLDMSLKDSNRQPSFSWAETFYTLSGNKIRIYTNGEFEVVNPSFSYYKIPPDIKILGSVDPATGVVVTTDVQSIFNDSIMEILIDQAAEILAGDIESMYQAQRLKLSTEENN